MDGASVLQVADHGDGQTVDGADLLADGEDVEQRLRRVLARSVAGVDQRPAGTRRRPLSQTNISTAHSSRHIHSNYFSN